MTLAAPARRPLTRRDAPSLADAARRALWTVVWATLFRLSPPPCHAWRRWLLARCGARVGRGAHVYPSARIRAPWKLTLGPHACLAPGVECYNVDEIELEEAAIVSQRAFLCAASHDYQRYDFALVAAPIVVGRHAWIAAEAFVGPGVSIGEGAVVAARAVATRDVAPWSCVAGNPARVVGRRERG
jgi:putative colanic acid biosynthesis acetyltransferase WcaF